MLLLLMEEGWPLDEVVFYDTGMEFKAIYHTMVRVRAILREKGIAFTILKPGYDFEWKMFDKPVNGRNASITGIPGAEVSADGERGTSSLLWRGIAKVPLSMLGLQPMKRHDSPKSEAGTRCSRWP